MRAKRKRRSIGRDNLHWNALRNDRKDSPFRSPFTRGGHYDSDPPPTLVEHLAEDWPDVFGHLLLSFSSGMDVVGLIQPGDAAHILEEVGNENGAIGSSHMRKKSGKAAGESPPHALGHPHSRHDDLEPGDLLPGSLDDRRD